MPKTWKLTRLLIVWHTGDPLGDQVCGSDHRYLLQGRVSYYNILAIVSNSKSRQ